MNNESDVVICPLCTRVVPNDSRHKHHLIPRSKKGKHKGTILLCASCGYMVHKLFTNKDLAKKYNTVEKLLNHPDVQTCL